MAKRLMFFLVAILLVFAAVSCMQSPSIKTQVPLSQLGTEGELASGEHAYQIDDHLYMGTRSLSIRESSIARHLSQAGDFSVLIEGQRFPLSRNQFHQGVLEAFIPDQLDSNQIRNAVVLAAKTSKPALADTRSTIYLKSVVIQRNVVENGTDLYEIPVAPVNWYASMRNANHVFVKDSVTGKFFPILYVKSSEGVYYTVAIFTSARNAAPDGTVHGAFTLLKNHPQHAREEYPNQVSVVGGQIIVDPPPSPRPQIALKTPAYGVTNQALAITFTWEATPTSKPSSQRAVFQLSEYDFYLRETGAQWGAPDVIANGATKTHDKAGLKGGTTYEWKVVAYQSAATEVVAATSAVFTFSTMPILHNPPQISLVYPGPNQIGVEAEVTFTWAATPGALKPLSARNPSLQAFHLYLAKVGEEFGAPIELGGADREYSPPTELDYTAQYKWKMKAIQSDTQVTETAESTFTVTSLPSFKGSIQGVLWESSSDERGDAEDSTDPRLMWGTIYARIAPYDETTGTFNPNPATWKTFKFENMPLGMWIWQQVNEGRFASLIVEFKLSSVGITRLSTIWIPSSPPLYVGFANLIKTATLPIYGLIPPPTGVTIIGGGIGNNNNPAMISGPNIVIGNAADESIHNGWIFRNLHFAGEITVWSPENRFENVIIEGLMTVNGVYIFVGPAPLTMGERAITSPKLNKGVLVSSYALYAQFVNTEFGKGAADKSGVFSANDTTIKGGLFKGNVNVTGAAFKVLPGSAAGGARTGSGTVFEGAVNIHNAAENASFSNSVFKNDVHIDGDEAEFDTCVFEKADNPNINSTGEDAVFKNAIFKENANFTSAMLSLKSEGVTYEKNLIAGGAGAVDKEYHEFTGGQVKGDATIADFARFTGVIFDKTVTVNHPYCRFYGNTFKGTFDLNAPNTVIQSSATAPNIFQGNVKIQTAAAVTLANPRFDAVHATEPQNVEIHDSVTIHGATFTGPRKTTITVMTTAALTLEGNIIGKTGSSSASRGTPGVEIVHQHDNFRYRESVVLEKLLLKTESTTSAALSFKTPGNQETASAVFQDVHFVNISGAAITARPRTIGGDHNKFNNSAFLDGGAVIISGNLNQFNGFVLGSETNPAHAVTVNGKTTTINGFKMHGPDGDFLAIGEGSIIQNLEVSKDLIITGKSNQIGIKTAMNVTVSALAFDADNLMNLTLQGNSGTIKEELRIEKNFTTSALGIAIKNLTVEGAMTVTGNADHVKFDNVHFKDNTPAMGGNIRHTTFDSCIFENGVNITGGSIGLSFIGNGGFKKAVTVAGISANVEDLTMNNHTFDGTVAIGGAGSQVKDLTMNNNTFEKPVTITNATNKAETAFTSNTFKQHLSIFCHNLLFANTTFTPDGGEQNVVMKSPNNMVGFTGNTSITRHVAEGNRTIFKGENGKIRFEGTVNYKAQTNFVAAAGEANRCEAPTGTAFLIDGVATTPTNVALFTP